MILALQFNNNSEPKNYFNTIKLPVKHNCVKIKVVLPMDNFKHI